LPSFSGNSFSKSGHISCTNNTIDSTQTPTRFRRSNSEQLEVNGKLFAVVRKRNISIKDKIKKIKKLLGKKSQPDINTQDGYDNQNTALHLAIVRNVLEVVNFLLSQGADITIEDGDGKTPLTLAEKLNHVDIFGELRSYVSQVKKPHSETDELASHNSQPVATSPNKMSVLHSNSHAAATGKQTASTVLLPFSGELTVDNKLELGNNYFKKINHEIS
jgi:ankyrin repeat protein